MKHIAMYIGSLSKGGAERVFINLAEFFYKKGYKVTFVTTFKYDEEYSYSEGIDRIISGLTPEEETGRLVNIYRRYKKLRDIWKKIKPDLILSAIGKNNVMAIETTRGLNIPVVVSVVADPAMEYKNESKVLEFLAFRSFKRAAGVVFQTTDARNYFPPKVRKKAVIMQNSLAEEFIRPIYEGTREKEVVAVGRLDENKNHKMLMDAFAEVFKTQKDWRLTIYGDGPLKKELESYADKLMDENPDMKGHVALMGRVSNVAGLIEKSGIFVLCSDTEGMPNALLEAMALGIPSISTDCPCGGPRDVIEDGVNGLLIPVKDTKALVAALRKIMVNEAFAKTIGQNASKLQEIYNPDAVNAKWEKYLTDLMQ
ncbi:MAG: glycosyltransferase [Butyrivibrio sp.]|nr:glycosyltransferase [Butyrivibrio sp.]